MKKVPDCPNCGEPLESYTDVTDGITEITRMTWDGRFYRATESERWASCVWWTCDACGAQLPDEPEPVEDDSE